MWTDERVIGMQRVDRCGLALNVSLDYSYVSKSSSRPQALVHLTRFNVWSVFPETLYMRTLHVNAHMHAYMAVRSRANAHIQHVIKQCNGHIDVLTPPFLRMNSHSQLTGTDVMFLLSLLSSALQGVSRRFECFTHTHRCRCFSLAHRLHLKGEWKARTLVNNQRHEF